MSFLTKKNAGAYDAVKTVKPDSIKYSDVMGHESIIDMHPDIVSMDTGIKNDISLGVSIGSTTRVINDITSDEMIKFTKYISIKNLFIQLGSIKEDVEVENL